MAIDPVCRMGVDEKTAQYKSEYEGVTYYFCSRGCKRIFEIKPQKYLKKR
jgi:YHS domain-containing protein